MKTHSLPKILRAHLVCAGLALGALTAAPSAQADGAKNLDRHDSSGFGDSFMRLGGSFAMVSGQGLGPADPVTNTTTLTDYKRTQYTLDFDMYGFWDATRFDSLIGAEFVAKLGVGGTEKFDSGDGKSGLYFRSDFAFDYGVVHWDGDVRGRISFGAGAGMDFAPRWYGGSRYYPQLLGRVQLWFGDLGVHASWHHLPATTGTYNDREHRFEVGVGTGPIHGGVRYTRTRIGSGETATPDNAKLNQNEFGIFVMAAF